MAVFNVEQSSMIRVQISASNLATKLLTTVIQTVVAEHAKLNSVLITPRVAPQEQNFGFSRL
ncbi:hypothetical protein [Arthrobacter sp. MYb213]|uniref:hypothetical protein n=1 Tax=Arthrobacter sp. MYb213 TaxID=1848595 RepID=UPI000CFB66CA|nr:hypothetical protein [Arthrobacter sp. MYb213]PRB70202.1 hypothetical protein CQ011_08540 [Arthrobacter sp. MYb213]